ncbi:hypothetical protein ONZ45_g10587 [Pleurotus djamor]|nr:hypothetical protein ONZ45_g10587 [Pleurotus djamor]
MKDSLQRLPNPPTPPSPKQLTRQEKHENERLSRVKSTTINMAMENISWPLPIRVYDVEALSFVTRSDVRNLVMTEITKAFKDRVPRADEYTYHDERLLTEMNAFAEMNTRLAILSHTWGATELTYKDAMTNPDYLKGDPKFAGLCKTAKTYGCRYAWMDSVCIDKSSSSELDESIRSMYTWYASARSSPSTAQALTSHINTDVSTYDLLEYKPSADNARKVFSYMEGRRTTVPEDAAYCLLGLLGIVLHPAYGEGRDSALYRLQVACAERSNDRGLFYWENCEPSPFNSMLPRDPFTRPPEASCCDLGGFRNFRLNVEHLWKATKQNKTSHSFVDHTFAFTNGGLRISVILHDCSRVEFHKFVINDTLWVEAYGVDKAFPSSSIFKAAILGTHGCDRRGHIRCFVIILLKCGPDDIPQYRRVSRSAEEYNINDYDTDNTEFLLSRVPETIYVV